MQSDLKSEEVTVEPPDEQKPEVNLAAEEAAALGIEDDTFAALEAAMYGQEEEGPELDLYASLEAAMSGKKMGVGQSNKILGNQDPNALWRDAYNIPITYKLVDAVGYTGELKKDSHTKRNTRDIINRAFEIWAKSGDLRFTEVSRDEDAEIKIMFVPNDHRNNAETRKKYPNGINGIPENTRECIFGDNGNGGVLAHAFMPPSDNKTHPANRRTDKYYDTKNDLAGDLHFDMAENWIFHPPSEEEKRQGKKYIFTTAVH